MAGAPFFVKAGTHPDRNRRDFLSFYELFSLGGPDSLDSVERIVKVIFFPNFITDIALQNVIVGKEIVGPRCNGEVSPSGGRA
jgi:hypothetical protein